MSSNQGVVHFVDIASATDNAAALKKRVRNSESVVDLDLAELAEIVDDAAIQGSQEWRCVAGHP